MRVCVCMRVCIAAATVNNKNGILNKIKSRTPLVQETYYLSIVVCFSIPHTDNIDNREKIILSLY